eukprot:TRINITY_DN1400_c0_g5_i2.p1 TRINITY_DN1400_c0_g5~~TRINITY_DN1400_c0_g5_i2.p1  ORF type:complete len:427 (-),score=68.63 TRINITY_DN1400_c0_g5_i2:65-1345(-)
MPPISQNCKHNFTDDKIKLHRIAEHEMQITLKEFYQFFWADSSFLQKLWDVIENTELQCTPWVKSEEGCCQTRKLTYRTPIRVQFPFGPKNTRVEHTQKCFLKNDSHLVIETSTWAKDIPYNDHFTVEELWNITSSGQSVKLTIDVQIKWKKSLRLLKVAIEKASIATSKTVLENWIVVANQTVEGRRQRSETVDNDKLPKITISQGNDYVTISSVEREKETKQEPTAITQLDTDLTNDKSSSLFSKQNITLLLSITSLLLLIILYSRPAQSPALYDPTEEFYQVYRDKLYFLEHYVAHLSLNLTNDPNAMTQEEKFWRGSKGLEYQLHKFKEDISNMQFLLKRLQINQKEYNYYKQDIPNIIDTLKEHGRYLKKVNDNIQKTEIQVVSIKWWNYLWYLPVVIAVIVTSVLHYGGYIQIQSPVIIN